MHATAPSLSEALTLALNTALLAILAMGMLIHAALKLRQVLILSARTRRRSISITVGLRLERFLCWCLLRTLDLVLFLACACVYFRRVGEVGRGMAATATGAVGDGEGRRGRGLRLVEVPRLVGR